MTTGTTTRGDFNSQRDILGPTDDIELDDDVTSQLDYEVELAVVIGRGGRRIRRETALQHVFGYTVVNDVSARDLQHDRPAMQFFLGESVDTYCPIGPVLVTTDEITAPHDLRLWLTVNGEPRQDATTRSMLADVPEIIEGISRYVTLEPGDVIGRFGSEGGIVPT